MIENNQIIFLIITYFVAAIPFGLIVTKKFLKEDIRDLGSGNIGATNVARIGGKKLGAITLILDALKGAIMVLLAMNYFAASENFDSFISLVAFVAVCGHVFPVYLKFKGGKGVATALAVMLAIDWLIGGLAIITWIATFFIFRISAVSSILAAISMIPLCYFLAFDASYIFLAIALSILIIIRHKENIARLILKKENKF